MNDWANIICAERLTFKEDKPEANFIENSAHPN